MRKKYFYKQIDKIFIKIIIKLFQLKITDFIYSSISFSHELYFAQILVSEL